MPAKPKTSAKVTNPEPKATPLPPPETVAQQSQHRYYQTNPAERRYEEVGFPGLTASEKKSYSHAKLIHPITKHSVSLSNKTEREFWKQITKESLPIRRVPKNYHWGQDDHGREIGDFKLEEFKKRSLEQARHTALDLLHRQFLLKREAARLQGKELPAEDIAEERKRRKEMASLASIQGGIPAQNRLANDPAWDDVVPIPQSEPSDALAKIAYPDEYAELISYLRAVMAAEEYSPRCLKLTEDVILLNPAHYTVWLYRFKIVVALKLDIPGEIQWLNAVALDNLKNYQIWHHRQLLLDYYYPTIEPDERAAKEFAKAEVNFIVKMLAEDTKNYHVWSYRQYLVQKVGLWNANELGSTQNLIEEDLRNNSAWSHRFYIVFSDPAHTTPGATPVQPDPKVPDAIVDRELNYAKEKIELAPQNQSAWNYLRGVLVKGRREVGTLKDFVLKFVHRLGEDDEDVRSTDALDLLAEIYEKSGDHANAKLCLDRLADAWDPVREGYWNYRASKLNLPVQAQPKVVPTEATGETTEDNTSTTTHEE